jgi:hypothetical protein
MASQAESVGLAPYRAGIEFLNPDFATLARACGGHGFSARKPDELKAAIDAAFAIDGPAIVDAVIVANELPNLPHLDGWQSRVGKGQGSASRPNRRVRTTDHNGETIVDVPAGCNTNPLAKVASAMTMSHLDPTCAPAESMP